MVTALMFCAHTNARLDIASSKKLMENWTKFVQAFLTPNVSCYKTAADYGKLEVTKLEDEKCDVRIIRKGIGACLKVSKDARHCKASMTDDKSLLVIHLLVSGGMFCYDFEAT